MSFRIQEQNYDTIHSVQFTRSVELFPMYVWCHCGK